MISSYASRCGLLAALLLIGGCDGLADDRPAATPVEVAAASPAELARQVLADLPAPPDDGLTHPTAIEDPTGAALTPLYAALARASRGEGMARIVFYGGSHTASDLYTSVIRRGLQRRFGDGGHGFVLPAPPISNYWQYGARIADGDGWTVLTPSSKRMGIDAYGIAGMAFESRDAAWAEVATERSRASRVEVMYLRQPGGGRLHVTIDGVSRILETSSDVVEPAIDVVAVPDGAHRVELRTEADGAPVRIYGVVLEREGPGVVVDQLAIAGSKARHQLLWDESVWLPLLRSRRPDLIALSYGNNELDDRHLTREQHEAHLVATISRLRRELPDAGCLVVGPSDRRMLVGSRWAVPPELPFFVEMSRRVAFAQGCAFFDTLAWQGGEGAVDRWLASDPPLERDDRVHLTERAYRLLGEALLRAIIEPMGESP